MYLLGVHFYLETDHHPLQYLHQTKFQNGRLMRWSLILQPYRFTVRAIKGSDNVGADFLSRFTDWVFEFLLYEASVCLIVFVFFRVVHCILYIGLLFITWFPVYYIVRNIVILCTLYEVTQFNLMVEFVCWYYLYHICILCRVILLSWTVYCIISSWTCILCVCEQKVFYS